MKRRGSVLPAMVIVAVVLALNTQSGAMSSPASPEKAGAPGIESVMYVFKSLSNQPASVRLPSDNPRPQPVWSVSHDDALNDIDLLFETLRHGYAGYELAGGDEAFAAARARAIGGLNRRGAQLETWEFTQALREALSHVQDSHLSIDGIPLCTHYAFCYDPFHEFVRTSEGEYRDSAGRVLMRVDGRDPGSRLLRSVSSSGLIVYVIGALSSEKHQNSVVELEFAGGDHEMAWLVPAMPLAPAGDIYSLSRMDGVPVVAVRSFGTDRDVSRAMTRFLADAASLRREPAIILDLRSNPGGSDSYGKEWLRLLVGSPVRAELAIAQLVTDTAVSLLMNAAGMAGDGNDSVSGLAAVASQAKRLADPARPGWARIERERATAPADSPWIVAIVDWHTASASESLIRRLRSLPKTIVMGSNTRGALLSGNAGLLVLPSSGVEVRVPTMMWLGPDLANNDGVGFSPDYWVHPDQAVSRAIAFINTELLP